MTPTLSKRQERREKFKKLGQALSALDEAWADRRGELVGREYRGVKSADATRCGPRTLQIVKLYDRCIGQRRAATVEEQAAEKARADFQWELIKQLHGVGDEA